MVGRYPCERLRPGGLIRPGTGRGIDPPPVREEVYPDPEDSCAEEVRCALPDWPPCSCSAAWSPSTARAVASTSATLVLMPPGKRSPTASARPRARAPAE